RTVKGTRAPGAVGSFDPAECRSASEGQIQIEFWNQLARNVLGPITRQGGQRNRSIDIVEGGHAISAMYDPLSDCCPFRNIRSNNDAVGPGHLADKSALQLSETAINLGITKGRTWQIAIVSVPRLVALEKKDVVPGTAKLTQQSAIGGGV